jgi:hypothetical protein
MKRFLYLLSITAVLLCACSRSTETTQVNRSLAQLKSFYFVKNDSMPGLAKAVFTVEERNDTGLVWNRDSILYGTSLKRVVPRFTFAATPDAAYLTMNDTIHVLTGYDTLDFTKTPIYLTIRSADKSNIKTYEIRATVHQADPDLYTWTQLSAGVLGRDDCDQRVVETGSDFTMLTSNGFDLRAYRSADGASWEDVGTMKGLPAGTKVRQIVSDGTTLYYGQDSMVYTSTDAVTWTGKKVSHPITTLLLYWNKHVWALVHNNKKYELAYIDQDTLKLSGLQPGTDFPVSDFGTVCFISSSLRERAMIIGGFAENGLALNTRWNLEYSSHIKENNGYRLQEYSQDRPSFQSMTGISIVYYNNQLLLFGGVDGNMTYLGRDVLVSTDEGLNWTKADTTKNRLPEAYQARQKLSTIVRENSIFIFGGEDSEQTYSDVYRGRLNSIDW